MFQRAVAPLITRAGQRGKQNQPARPPRWDTGARGLTGRRNCCLLPGMMMRMGGSRLGRRWAAKVLAGAGFAIAVCTQSNQLACPVFRFGSHVGTPVCLVLVLGLSGWPRSAQFDSPVAASVLPRGCIAKCLKCRKWHKCNSSACEHFCVDACAKWFAFL